MHGLDVPELGESGLDVGRLLGGRPPLLLVVNEQAEHPEEIVCLPFGLD
jgi:hypothetical protein